MSFTNRTERRGFESNKVAEMIKVQQSLNYFCFHGSGADDNCKGCCFENENPCPLNTFYTKLTDEMYKECGVVVQKQ